MSDDVMTTCHRAFAIGSDKVASLVVSTDGEDFNSSITIIEDFPEGDMDDIFSDNLLVADAVWLGKSRFVLAEGTGLIIEVNGRRSQETANLDVVLSGITTLGSGELAVFGPDGRVFVGAGANWRPLPPLEADVLDVAGAGSDRLYACGEQGLLAAFDGTAWTTFDLGTNVALNALLLEGGDALVVCGAKGLAGRFSGGQWEAFEAPEVDFYGLARFKGLVHAGAGPDGLLTLSGRVLEVLKEDVFAYALTSSDAYLAIAGENRIVRYDGSEFPFAEIEEDFT